MVPGSDSHFVAPALDEFLRSYLTPRGRVAFYAAARNIALEEPDEFWEGLKELSPESLFIWGRRDSLVPIGFARHVQERLPAARHCELDCGHVPQLERPAQLHSRHHALPARPAEAPQRPAHRAAPRPDAMRLRGRPGAARRSTSRRTRTTSPGLSGMVAYNLLLSLFPLALLALFIASRVLRSAELEDSVFTDLQRLFPSAAEGTITSALNKVEGVVDRDRDRSR